MERMLVSYTDRPWLIADEPELRPSINSLLKHKSASGFQPTGDNIFETNSYFDFWTLNDLQARYCETEEIAKSVTVCKCIQADEYIVVEVIFFTYKFLNERLECC